MTKNKGMLTGIGMEVDKMGSEQGDKVRLRTNSTINKKELSRSRIFFYFETATY